MIKKFLLTLFFSFWCSLIFSQQLKETTSIDSLDYYIAEIRKTAFENSPKALRLLKRAEEIAEKSDNPEDLGNVALSYGMVYYVRGDYEEALQYYLQAHEIYRKSNNNFGMARAQTGHGLILQGIDRNNEAINLFERAISNFKKANKYEASSAAHINIAISEIEVGKLESAKKNLETAIDLVGDSGRRSDLHLAWNKLGQISFLEGKLEQAIKFHTRVLNDPIEPNGWEKSYSHAGLAQVYLRQEKYELAEEHALKAIGFAKNAESIWDLERNTGILYRIYEEKGASEMALEYLKINQKFRDSLYNEKKLREINFLQLESKEEENSRLVTEKDLTERKLGINRVILILVIAVSLFLIVLVFLLRRNTKIKERYNTELVKKNQTILEQNNLISEKNQELIEINKSKDQLFSILSHDLRGPIGSIKQLLELMQSGNFSAEEKQLLFEEMQQQVSVTSEMLQNLLTWANSQLKGAKTNPETINLPTQVSEALEVYSFAAKSKNIQVIHEIPKLLSPVKVDKDQLMIIFHNLISNAIKFTNEGRYIYLSYKETETHVQVKFKDGGEGISREKIKEILSRDERMFSEVGTKMETGTGLGLMLVKQFLKANDATLDIKSIPGKGAEFIVSFLKSVN